MRLALLTLAAVAGLAAPAPASAHARSPAVALDYRLRLEPAPAGLHVRILAAVAFAVRDQPSGGTSGLTIGAASAVALAFAAALLRVGGRRRAHAAGLAGAASAAVTIASLPVFWHGVVISALPGGAARLACAVALVGGASAAALSLLPEFDA